MTARAVAELAPGSRGEPVRRMSRVLPVAADSGGTEPRASVRAVLRLTIGLGLLAAIVTTAGPAPLARGLHAVTAPALGAAAALTVLTTVCSAWRWTLVARGLGVELSLPVAVAAYYRSQFLNLVLPGGIVGDVHRGVINGKGAGSISGGLRAVAWERTTGQVVQALVALFVLVALPSPARPVMPIVLIALGAALATGAGLHLVARTPTTVPQRLVRWVAQDLRAGPLAPGARLQVGFASLVVVAGHTAVFLLAARTAGPPASLATLLPLAMLVQLATSVPLGIAGWGPREGAAAWAFAAAGLGAGTGISVTTLYAVLALSAVLPGAAVLVAETLRGAVPGRRVAPRGMATPRQLTVARSLEGGGGG